MWWAKVKFGIAVYTMSSPIYPKMMRGLRYSEELFAMLRGRRHTAKVLSRETLTAKQLRDMTVKPVDPKQLDTSLKLSDWMKDGK
jgi:hypothetical protein